jgi:hypothetical protein
MQSQPARQAIGCTKHQFFPTVLKKEKMFGSKVFWTGKNFLLSSS